MKVDCPYERLLISQESRLGAAGLREGEITEGRVLWRAVCGQILKCGKREPGVCVALIETVCNLHSLQ